MPYNRKVTIVAFKTYVPGLVIIFRAAHRFATRYQAQLQTHLTGPQYTCLVSTIAALADCLAVIHPPAPVP
jgi:hypothetical protein